MLLYRCQTAADIDPVSKMMLVNNNNVKSWLNLRLPGAPLSISTLLLWKSGGSSIATGGKLNRLPLLSVLFAVAVSK